MNRKHLALIITLTILLLMIAACTPQNTVTLGQSTMSGPLEISGAGSASDPALFLNGDSDTGIYQSAPNNFDISIAGSQALNLSSSGLDLTGTGLLDSTGAITFTDSILIDGQVDAEQLVVQGNGTQTNNTFVVEQSDGTDRFTVSDAGNVVAGGTLNVSGTSTFQGNTVPNGNVTHGSTSIDTTADVTINGLANSDDLGRDVALAGDVNGDGYTDILVGANLANGAGTDRGQAYIYYGGASMDNTADVTFNGSADNDGLGYAVAGAGDVNGDGYADVIVAAKDVDNGGTDRGQAYIYFGGASMDSTADVTFSGTADNDQLGYDVAAAGDVNGDGYADVIVGVKGAAGGGTDRGQALIYFGGASMDNTADVTINGAADNDGLGDAVASAGDVNGDGYADVIVGAVDADSGFTNNGQAYIYFGGASMDGTADVTISGAANSDHLGDAVASAGDVNGDGYADVIVGIESGTGGGTDRGEARIYYGGASMDSTADVTINGAADNDALGFDVATAGDVNSDGYADVIVGAKDVDASGTDLGQVYIYYGGTSMDTTADVTFTGSADGDSLGYSVAPAGDVNGDGYPDVIAGAKEAAGGGSNRGQAYIFQSSGNRWQTTFATTANIKRTLQMPALTLDNWKLRTTSQFGIETPNWNINRTGNAGVQDLTVGNNATIAGTLTHPDATNAGNVFALYNTIDNGDTSAKTMGVIPANANIIDVSFTVSTLFDGSGADNVDCGINGGDTDAYVDNLDVSSTGVNRMGDAADMPEATSLGDVGSSNVTVDCVYTDGAGNSSAGAATLVIDYIVD